MELAKNASRPPSRERVQRSLRKRYLGIIWECAVRVFERGNDKEGGGSGEEEEARDPVLIQTRP